MSTRGAAELAATKRVLGWARQKDCRLWWGKGTSDDGSCYLMLDYGGVAHYLCGVRTGYRKPYIQLTFRDMKVRPPFDDEAKREELRQRLNTIQGVSIPADALARYPSLALSALTSDGSLKCFLSSLEWVMDQVKGT